MASAAAAPAPAPAEGEARPFTPSSGKRPPSRRMPPLDTAKKRAREEAEEQLASAVASTNLEAIDKALETAKAAGIEGDHPAFAIVELVKSEIEHHESMKRRAAEILEAGVSAKSLVALGAGLEAAKRLGVETGSLEKAESARKELDHKKIQAEAAEDLCRRALEKRDLAALKAALQQAETDGVDVEYSQAYIDAANLRDDLEEREASVNEATSLLLKAIAGEDVPKLEEAIAHAKTLDVDTSEGVTRLEALKQAQADKLAALAALEKVCDGEDLDAIDAALAKASEAGVADDALAKAKVQREKVEEVLEARSSAIMNLEMVGAEEGDEVEAYDVALEAAATAGVADDHSAVELCRKARAAAVERNATKAAALDACSKAASIEELEAALSKATELALVEDEVRDAADRLAQLQADKAKRDEAEEALQKASASDSLAQVDEALARAEEVGVDMSGAAALQCKAKKDALEAQAKARAAATASLIEARGGDALDILERALDAALASGVDPDSDEVLDAKAKRDLLHTRKSAEEALDAAMTSDDPEAIGHLLEFLRFSSPDALPSDEKLLEAEQRRDELAVKVEEKRAALGRLLEALAARDIQAIDAALSSAVAAGCSKESDEIVEAGKAREAIVAEEQAKKEASDALTEAMAKCGDDPSDEDALALRKCVEQAEALKVDVTAGRAALDAADAACAKRKADEAARSKAIAALTILAAQEASTVDELRAALDEADAAFVRRSSDEYKQVSDLCEARVTAQSALTEATAARPCLLKVLEARTAEAKASGLKDDAAFAEAQKVSDALRGHEALLRDLAARCDPGVAEALEKAAADGFTEDEAVTLARASKGLLDALASGDVATVDAAITDAACLGDCPAVTNAKEKRDQLESDLAATKLQGARRSSLAKERVKQLTKNEEDRVAAIAELKRASAAACASLEASFRRTEEPGFPKVLRAATDAVALLDRVVAEVAASAPAPAGVAEGPAPSPT